MVDRTAQRSLFDPRAAAAAKVSATAPTIREAVLRFLRGRGEHGATDAELAVELNLIPDTARARRRELVQAGAVRDAGRTRLGPHGNQMTIWTAAPARADDSAGDTVAYDEGARASGIPAPIDAAPHALNGDGEPCPRCGGRTVDVPIHAGRSTRRDCSRCGRFLCFPVWYGQPTGSPT